MVQPVHQNIQLIVQDIPYRHLRPDCFEKWSHVVQQNAAYINKNFIIYFRGPFLQTYLATLSLQSESWQKYVVLFYLLTPRSSWLYVFLAFNQLLPGSHSFKALSLPTIATRKMLGLPSATCIFFSSLEKFQLDLRLGTTIQQKSLKKCMRTSRLPIAFRRNHNRLIIRFCCGYRLNACETKYSSYAPIAGEDFVHFGRRFFNIQHPVSVESNDKRNICRAKQGLEPAEF